jgi:hypothetical protein
MSIERTEVTIGKPEPTKSSLPSIKDLVDGKLTEAPPQVEETKAQRKARLLNVLDRSPVNARFQVILPNGRHPEWIRNDALEIDRMKALGFEMARADEVATTLHNDGTGKAIVGDVVLMTCSREDKEMIDEIRREQQERLNGKPGGDKEVKEEREFKKVGDSDVPTFNEGRTHTAKADDIKSALNIKD